MQGSSSPSLTAVLVIINLQTAAGIRNRKRERKKEKTLTTSYSTVLAMQKASTAQQQQKPGANVSFHFLNYDRSLLLTPYNVVVAKKIGTNVN